MHHEISTGSSEREQITLKYTTKELEPNHTLYLTSEHVLANEICEKTNTHMSNISNLKLESILKFGNCPIINKNDTNLPPKLKHNVQNMELTSLENKIPLSYFKSNYNLKTSEILTYIADSIETIAGKQFLVYKDSFLSKIKNNKYNIDNMIYIVNKSEFSELQKTHKDLEFIKINSKKYIIIY